jgi:hypothetical protein
MDANGEVGRLFQHSSLRSRDQPLGRVRAGMRPIEARLKGFENHPFALSGPGAGEGAGLRRRVFLAVHCATALGCRYWFKNLQLSPGFQKGKGK